MEKIIYYTERMSDKFNIKLYKSDDKNTFYFRRGCVEHMGYLPDLIYCDLENAIEKLIYGDLENSIKKFSSVDDIEEYLRPFVLNSELIIN